MYLEILSILNLINPKDASVIVTNSFSSFLSNTILFPCFELYARMAQWSERISPISMNPSTVNNSKSQRIGSSRSYILESDFLIINGTGVSMNKLQMVIVFIVIFLQAGFVVI